MGRIKSLLVKKTAKNILKEQNHLTEDFEKNKIYLKKLDTSKTIQNKIGGYIVRLKRREREKKAVIELKN